MKYPLDLLDAAERQRLREDIAPRTLKIAGRVKINTDAWDRAFMKSDEEQSDA